MSSHPFLAPRSPPKSESTEATPVSSPRSLKKFALGLRQSRSLGRGAFAKEDWSFYARQRRQENPQVSCISWKGTTWNIFIKGLSWMWPHVPHRVGTLMPHAEKALIQSVPLWCSQREKRDYVGKVPKRRTPPAPVWETPVIKKKLGLFFILGPQEHFWSSPKNHHFGW